MEAAIAEAERAIGHDDVPVGAVIVRDGAIIAARHNERELTGDPTAHAEILAIRDAASVVGHWRLDDCTMVVTLEPCAMCAGALVNARMGQTRLRRQRSQGGRRRQLDDPRRRPASEPSDAAGDRRRG